MGSFLSCLRETEHSAMAKRLQPIFREVVREVLQELREYIRKLKKQIKNCLSEQLLLRTIRIYLLFLRVDLKPAPASFLRSGTACA